MKMVGVALLQWLVSSHQGGVRAGIDGEEHGCHRDEGFPCSDITLEQAVHGSRLAHVDDDFLDGTLLGICEIEGQGVVKCGEESSPFS